MVQAKRWYLAKHFEGTPNTGNFTLEKEVLPNLKDGGMVD